MAGIGLNPSGCCCTPTYTCAVTITLGTDCSSDVYRGRVRVSSAALGFSQTVTGPATGFPIQWHFLVPSAGSYLIETLDAPPTRCDPISVMQSLPCFGSVTLKFPLSAGYICHCSVDNTTSPFRPIPTTLSVSDSIFGAASITYSPSFTLPAQTGTYSGFVGTKAVTFGAVPPNCPATAGVVTYAWIFTDGSGFGVCQFGIYAQVTNPPPTCPSGGSEGFQVIYSDSKTNVPLFFSKTQAVDASHMPYSGVTTPVTWTVSE